MFYNVFLVSYALLQLNGCICIFLICLKNILQGIKPFCLQIPHNIVLCVYDTFTLLMILNMSIGYKYWLISNVGFINCCLKLVYTLTHQ